MLRREKKKRTSDEIVARTRSEMFFSFFFREWRRRSTVREAFFQSADGNRAGRGVLVCDF